MTVGRCGQFPERVCLKISTLRLYLHMAASEVPLQPTSTEEDYLKATLKLGPEGQTVSTNALSAELKTTPASVTDMIKRLGEKGLVLYTPYRGVSLTDAGRRIALRIVRKHRLWEVFLVNKLNFSWDQVHETAEQLEHVRSAELIQKLDEFLGFPKFDPHGDPIPNDDGEIVNRPTHALSLVPAGQEVTLARVLLHTPEFLQYLDRLGLVIGTMLTVLEHMPFDDSRLIRLAGKELLLSPTVTANLLVV
jgi:DtxR family transcriptional regulator, Mn-dependent transcriptional regulator